MEKLQMKRILPLVAMLVLLLPLRETLAQEQVVRLGSFSRAIDYAPYLIAKAHGWFEEVVEVEYSEFQSLASVNSALATGKVDIVFEAAPPAIIAEAAGIDITIIGAGSSLQQEIIVPIDSKISHVAQLSGKKIATLTGTSSHYGVVTTARKAGIDPKNVTLINMAPPDARAAFESGYVDGWAVWPPWVEQEILAKRARTLPGGAVAIQSIMVARASFAQEHHDLVLKVRSVVERAKRWIDQNPKQAQSIVSEVLGIKRSVVELAWRKHNFSAELSQEVRADIQTKAHFLFDIGIARQRIEQQELFETGLSNAE